MDTGALELLKKMLVVNPYDRITASDALEHPYFQGMHSSLDDSKPSSPCPTKTSEKRSATIAFYN